jgi:CRISPR-associated protein Cmr2
MAEYLLLVSVGPIQDFISAARKAQDLWFGSWLLSDLARATTTGIAEAAGGVPSFVFPATAAGEGEESPSVANKLLCRLEGTPEAVRAVAEAGRRAMEDRLRAHATPLFDQASAVAGARFDRARALAQIDDLMEYQWVAVPFEGRDYFTVWKLAEAELAAAKNTRRWREVTWGVGVPKSSIDGLRESVFDEQIFEAGGADVRRRLHLKDAERLCGVGYLKRRGAEAPDDERPGGPSGRARPVFHSASHVAAATLRMRALHRDARSAMIALRTELERLEVLPRVKARPTDEIARAAQCTPATFPAWAGPSKDEPPQQALATQSLSAADAIHMVSAAHGIAAFADVDGVVFYPDRLPDLFDEAKGSREVPQEVLERLADVHRALGVSRDTLPTYYVMLLADGDGMGACLETLGREHEGLERHRQVSKNLVAFARRAADIVVAHGGSPIYTGGDDVLAFVPLPTALACADDLRRAFAAMVRTSLPETASPTLSVGLAIAHHLADLSEVRRLAKEAEGLAKRHPGKNALGIVVDRRSGPRIRLVGSWDAVATSGERSLRERLDEYAGWLHQRLISRKTAHDLREALIPLIVGSGTTNNAVIRSTVKAVLRQKSAGVGREHGDLEQPVKLFGALLDSKTASRLETLGDELDVAWMLCKAYETALGLEGARLAEESQEVGA